MRDLINENDAFDADLNFLFHVWSYLWRSHMLIRARRWSSFICGLTQTSIESWACLFVGLSGDFYRAPLSLFCLGCLLTVFN